MSSYSSTCRSVVTAMGISSASINVKTLSDVEILSFTCMNDGFSTRFDILIDENHNQVTISSRPQWFMPRSKFATTLRYMTLLNYKLNMGSVDMDMSDGEVRFKTSACLGNASNIRPIVRNFMNCHVNDGKQYLEGFTAIKKDDADSDAAMRAAGYGGRGGGGSSGSGDDAADLILRLLRLSMS